MLPKRLKVPIGLLPKTTKVILRDAHATVRVAPNGLGFNRLGVNFKAKAFKTAVLRNKLKRTVFNFFKDSDLLKTTGRGQDILITLEPAVIPLNQKDLKNILEKYARTF